MDFKNQLQFLWFSFEDRGINRRGSRSKDAEINKRHIESYNVVDIRSEINMELFCRRCVSFLLLLWTFHSVVFAQQQGKQR